MLRYSENGYPRVNMQPKDRDALKYIYEEDIQKAVIHLLSLTKIPEGHRDTVFETCFLTIALSEEYEKVLRQVFQIR